MARRTFRLLKDTPEVEKGGLVQEACDDGTQSFKIIAGGKYGTEGYYNRKVVFEQPKFFEEVFTPSAIWLTKEQLNAFQKLALKVKGSK